MFTISTGEPPTPPVNASSQLPSSSLNTTESKSSSRGFEDSGKATSDFEDSGRVPSDYDDNSRIVLSSVGSLENRTMSELEDSGRIQSDFEDSGRIVPQQEPDSGYEASPCSIADTSYRESLHFFGDDEAEDCDVFEDEDDFVHVGLNDSSEYCNDCTSLNCRCNNSGNSRPESSSAAETVLEGEDLSNCDSSDSSSRRGQPSSLPIRIPGQQIPRTSPVLVFPFHPRSCPAAWLAHHQTSNSSRSVSDLEERLRRRASLQSQRRRRMQIDSDASSDVGSSDDNFLSDDGLDNGIFPMAAGERDEEAARRLVPLPDLVLNSTANSNSTVRRGRSASVNLPPEPEVLQNIGRSLRRMSDEFQSIREAGQNRRRQTITSCDSYYRAS